MSAGTYNMTIEQGADYSTAIDVAITAFDFTGYTARAKVRSGFDAAAATIVALTCTVGSITSGHMPVTISLTAAQTAAIAFAKGSARSIDIGYWDLEIVSSGMTPTVIRVLQGTVALSRECTVA